MGELLLGIDVGTYSSKAVVTRPDGSIVTTASVAHAMDVPRPGWAEQDADTVWWADVVSLCKRVTSDAAVGDGIGGVAVSAIGPCLLPLDARDRPLRPGILYGIDTRATGETAELERSLGRDAVRARYHMDLSSQAVGPKVLWLRRNEPDVWRATRRLTTASSYLVHRLTGEHVIDHHTAAHWMPLYDPVPDGWRTDLGDVLADPAMLPRPGWSDGVAGRVLPGAAQLTGLPAGIPVAVGAVDALSEALSVGLGRVGDLMIMYGSTTFFILFTETRHFVEGMWALPGALHGQHVVAGGMATTGALTQWFVREFARESPSSDAYDALFAAAADVEPGARGLLMLPYFSGERTPLNDPNARGVIAGLTLAHRREDVFRAILEGVAFGVRHNIETLEAAGDAIHRVRAVGGGTSGGTWPQIVSDVTRLRQDLPEVTMGASYGDAYLAGLAAGLVRPGANDEWAARTTTVVPADSAGAYDGLYRGFRRLYESTRDVVHELAER